ncbi:MAG: hypothetical protein ACR2RF_25405 [Geminicoccaceae bacterium]
MSKFRRVNAVSFTGAGDTDDEARTNQVRRIRQYADDMEAGTRTDDTGVQVLYDGDPGGGPCAPAVHIVAEVRLDIPLSEDQDDDD